MKLQWHLCLNVNAVLLNICTLLSMKDSTHNTQQVSILGEQLGDKWNILLVKYLCEPLSVCCFTLKS